MLQKERGHKQTRNRPATSSHQVGAFRGLRWDVVGGRTFPSAASCAAPEVRWHDASWQVAPWVTGLTVPSCRLLRAHSNSYSCPEWTTPAAAWSHWDTLLSCWLSFLRGYSFWLAANVKLIDGLRLVRFGWSRNGSCRSVWMWWTVNFSNHISHISHFKGLF